MKEIFQTGIYILAFAVLTTVGHAQTTVGGFADLHTHPASFLGFGADDQYGENGLVWGKPAHDFARSGGCSPGCTLACTGGLDRATSTTPANLASDLPPCAYCSLTGVPIPHNAGFCHNNRAGADPVTIVTDNSVVAELDATSPGWVHLAGGYPNFSPDSAHAWPAALTVDHQVMHIDNIYRAFQGGLRLMFAAAVDDEVLSKLWTQGINAPKPTHDPGFDNNSAAKQLTYITNLVNANSTWMQIVKTPAEARAAINSNKLAVVLSLEVDSLSLPQIQVLALQFGVAHVIPVHLADNPAFGGTAIYSDIFNGLTNFIKGSPESGHPDPNVSFTLATPAQTIQPVLIDGYAGWQPGGGPPFPAPVQVPGQINNMDLNVPNFLALMNLGLLLDIAHMGQTTASTALRLAQQYNYPLMDSHTGLRCDSGSGQNGAATSGPTSGFPQVPCETPFGTVQGPVPAPSPTLTGSCGNPPVDQNLLVNERGLPVSQVAIIKQLGGVIGFGEVPHTLQAKQRQINCNTTASTPFVVPDQTKAGPWAAGPTAPAAWVYFQGTNNALWRVRADGTNQSQITNPTYGANTTASPPFVTPPGSDGHSWVYFQGTNNALWRVRDDGAVQTQITSPKYGANTTASTPFVVPDQDADHGWVYFQGTNNALWRVRDDGSNQTQITSPQYGANTTASPPFVTPPGSDGHSWVYFQGTNGNALWRVRDDGAGQSRITSPTYGANTTASTPFVVPDQDADHGWVYFQGTNGNALWRVRDDGSNQSQITSPVYGPNTTASPPFVTPPDIEGHSWVYFQGTNGNNLWRVRDDGALQTQVNGGNNTASSPFVTPDGWVYFQGTGNASPFQGGALWEAPSILVDPDPVTTWINEYSQALFLMGGQGVALGTDADGLSPLIQQDVIPTQYPFTLNFCPPPSPATCQPQQLSQYTFGARPLNFQTDGIANYGLLPDFIQAASQSRIGYKGKGAPAAQIAALFHTAEDTIEMWEGVVKAQPGQVFAFDYDGSGKLDHLVLYQPGAGTIRILKNSAGTFAPVYQGSGIGGYDLASTADQVFPFDYDGSGRLDHLVLYRPGTGTIWILKNSAGTFSPVYQGGGIGGYDLASTADQVFPFDYDGSGKLDHLVLYRPGTGTIWILKSSAGTFTPVYHAAGIGGYDFASTADQAFAFDYDGSGKLDHLVLYRPGTGTIWILKNSAGTFSPVYQGGGIGGYDLASTADQVFAFDYDSSGKLDHLVLYRPGTETAWVLKNSAGTFTPVYQGGGVGGYDLESTADKVAFDYDGSGKQDHLVLHRPGKGTILTLTASGGSFTAVGHPFQ